MKDTKEPIKDTFQSLLQILTAEAIYRDIRPDREAVDDLVIDVMAGELESRPEDGQEIAGLWHKFSGRMEEIYTGVTLALACQY